MNQSDLDQILKRKGYSIEKVRSSISRTLQINDPHHGHRGCLDTVYPISDTKLKIVKQACENNSKDTRKASKLESNPSHAALGKVQVQKATSSRFLVRITAVRKRLIDTDNLCEKYHVDLCRYASMLPDDNPEQTIIETKQRKIEKGEIEHTLIEIEEFK